MKKPTAFGYRLFWQDWTGHQIGRPPPEERSPRL